MSKFLDEIQQLKEQVSKQPDANQMQSLNMITQEALVTIRESVAGINNKPHIGRAIGPDDKPFKSIQEPDEDS